jgi:hypothetical protein
VSIERKPSGLGIEAKKSEYSNLIEDPDVDDNFQNIKNRFIL